MVQIILNVGLINIQDESLILHIKHFAEISREQQFKCQQAEIPYFDTSDNFNYVLIRAYDYVIHKLNE